MGQTEKVVIGVSVGVAVGILLASCAYFATKWYRRRSHDKKSSDETSRTSLPMCANGTSVSIVSRASTLHSEDGYDLQRTTKTYRCWGHQGRHNRDPFASTSGIPRYPYKDIQKATQNFTTILGEGSFGPVYKAVMPTNEVVAVKVLANKSTQGEKEFQTEVFLLSRLHHRNLVNLVGYCVDKGQRMLVYEFMTNGSLQSLLYGDGPRTLSWEQRFQIAHDVSHGIEYLHEGASPPVIHRDLKSANILLDKSMRAKVADFGLSKEEVYDGRKSGLKGTYGYMDPDYMSTNKSSKKSDIYSFGIIIFELITAINPQQGLVEYINLASISSDGKPDWGEIIDKKLAEESNLEEVRELANIAYSCLHNVPRKRPSIADVTQAISSIKQSRLKRNNTMASLMGDASGVLQRIELQQTELNNMTSLKKLPSL